MYCSTCCHTDQPFGMPEHHARRFVLRVEEVELRDRGLPVIALLRFLDAHDVAHRGRSFFVHAVP